MKKSLTVCFALLVFGATTASAQGILDKIDKVLNKADQAAGSADKASKTGLKAAGLFGKKSAAAETNTIIKFSGVDFSMLKSINEKVQTAKGVASTKMKFNASSSTIQVQHAGTSEELLTALQKVSATTFAEKNLEGLDDGEILIKINK
ncbi:hypothetical protein [Pedobacter frigoris]|uniref:hypothetical protein n=1 Tax=Pedobacter frigoris TaxID=2571272 RepID=UPI00292DB163|nr:hypothetical protein [Pedobacter frigoris]